MRFNGFSGLELFRGFSWVRKRFERFSEVSGAFVVLRVSKGFNGDSEGFKERSNYQEDFRNFLEV